mmetsp:Transcript_31253/g.85835  ORF Transcript_31253/g.85835 Transcript_31253/m.85835 type:complete len:291 (+) Transcript_31253:706-1578(+)
MVRSGDQRTLATTQRLRDPDVLEGGPSASPVTACGLQTSAANATRVHDKFAGIHDLDNLVLVPESTCEQRQDAVGHRARRFPSCAVVVGVHNEGETEDSGIEDGRSGTMRRKDYAARGQLETSRGAQTDPCPFGALDALKMPRLRPSVATVVGHGHPQLVIPPRKRQEDAGRVAVLHWGKIARHVMLAPSAGDNEFDIRPCLATVVTPSQDDVDVRPICAGVAPAFDERQQCASGDLEEARNPETRIASNARLENVKDGSARVAVEHRNRATCACEGQRQSDQHREAPSV